MQVEEAVETRWRAGRRAVLLVLLVAVPLVFDTGVRPPFALPKLTVTAVGALLILVLAGAEWAIRRSPPRWRNPLAVPVLLLLAWTAVSAAASEAPGTSLLGARESLNGLVTAAILAVLFFAVAEAFDSSHVRTTLSVLWFGAGGPVLLYGAIQVPDGWDPIPWPTSADEWPVWSTLGNPNDLAGFLAVILPLGVVLLVVTRKPWARVLTAAMIVVLLGEMLLTTSRGAWLGATAAVLALAAWFSHELRRRARLVTAVGAMGLAVVVGAAVLFLATGQTTKAPGDLLATGQGTTASLRLELFRTGLRMAERNPVVGVGPEGFERSFDAFRSDRFLRVYGPNLVATDAHNLFVNALATLGVPGLLALLALFAAALRLLARTGRHLGRSSPPEESQALFAAVCAGLLAYVVQAMFNRHDLTLDLCFWVLLGLACAIGGAGGVTPRRQPPAGGQPVRRGRIRATTATTTATAPTASATQEIELSPSSSAPAATSSMSLHHSWRSVCVPSLRVRRTAQPRASPGWKTTSPSATTRTTHSWMSPRQAPSLRPPPRDSP